MSAGLPALYRRGLDVFGCWRSPSKVQAPVVGPPLSLPPISSVNDLLVIGREEIGHIKNIQKSLEVTVQETAGKTTNFRWHPPTSDSKNAASIASSELAVESSRGSFATFDGFLSESFDGNEQEEDEDDDNDEYEDEDEDENENLAEFEDIGGIERQLDELINFFEVYEESRQGTTQNQPPENCTYLEFSIEDSMLDNSLLNNADNDIKIDDALSFVSSMVGGAQPSSESSSRLRKSSKSNRSSNSRASISSRASRTSSASRQSRSESVRSNASTSPNENPEMGSRLSQDNNRNRNSTSHIPPVTNGNQPTNQTRNQLSSSSSSLSSSNTNVQGVRPPQFPNSPSGRRRREIRPVELPTV